MKAVQAPELKPRALVHHGVVDASGFLFDTRLMPVAEAQQRILSLWVPGSVVYRVADGLLLQLLSPRRISCDGAPGLPLVAFNQALLATPLMPDELSALDPPANSVVLVRGGIATVENLQIDAREDPATWVDVSGFHVVEMISLGGQPPAPRLLVEPEPFDTRARLKKVPGESPELASFLAALQAKLNGQEANAAATAKPSRGAILGTWFTGIFDRMAAVLRSKPKPRSEAAPPAPGKSVNEPHPAWIVLCVAIGVLLGACRFGDFSIEALMIPFVIGLALVALIFAAERFGWFVNSAQSQTAATASKPSPKLQIDPHSNRFMDRMRHLTARLAMITGLARVVGWRQARYIARMMDMFERGQFEEALRHAIPMASLADLKPAPLLLGVPLPRLNLRISPRSTRAGSSIGLSPDLSAHLRRLYRASFEKLQEQGRIEEAAFVLAELLQANEEAVAFLERHGQLRLAAEMAEGRNLTPGLVVRQWFVADECGRAVLIARRTGAFADAVLRLEHAGQKEQASVLRLLWANALAHAGSYEAAVEAIWPVASARHIAMAWVERAMEIGGIPTARMLARGLTLIPEEFNKAALDSLRARALSLLEEEDSEGAAARLAFSETLRSGEHTPSAVALARAAVRAVTRDAALGYSSPDKNTLYRFVDFSRDGALRADMPDVPAVAIDKLSARRTPLEITVAAADRGTLPIYDAAYLPGGRCVVALGEAGARLLARDGRTLAHFDQPAHHLIVSEGGDRAIAVAPRGEAQRLARLDFVTRKAESWCDTAITAWASTYDGALWFVAAKGDFLAVDATSQSCDALWRTTNVGGMITSIAYASTQCSLLVYSRGNRDTWGKRVEPWEKWERWTFALPELILRHRLGAALPPNDGSYIWRAVNPAGQHVDVHEESTTTDKGISYAGDTFIFSRELGANLRLSKGESALSPTVSETWAVIPILVDGGIRCQLRDLLSLQVHVQVSLAGAERVAVRLTSETLIVGDDKGRLLAIDLEQGALLRDVRLF